MPPLPNMIAEMVGKPVMPKLPGTRQPPARGNVPYRSLLLSYAQRDNWPNFIRAQYGLPPAGQDLIDPTLINGVNAPRKGPQPRSAVSPIGVAPPPRPIAPQATANPFPMMTAIAEGRAPSEAFALPARPAAQQQQVDLPALFRSQLR